MVREGSVVAFDMRIDGQRVAVVGNVYDGTHRILSFYSDCISARFVVVHAVFAKRRRNKGTRCISGRVSSATLLFDLPPLSPITFQQFIGLLRPPGAGGVVGKAA